MPTRSRCLARLLYVGLLLFIPGLALAGPNEGGTLILHANPGIVFTSDIQNYCGMSALDSCSVAVTSVDWDPGKRIVFHVLAAFPPGSSPRLKALSFGIDYDPTKFKMAARSTCADFELSDGTWPAPGTGTSQSWTTGAQTGLLTEIYWFAGYAYSEQDADDSTSVSLIPHPLQHGVFVDDSFPAEVDTIAAYGTLGFGMSGHSACVGTPGGDSADGGETPDTPGGPDNPTDREGAPPPQTYAIKAVNLKTGAPVSGVAVDIGENYRWYYCPDEECISPQCSIPIVRQRSSIRTTGADGIASSTFSYYYCEPNHYGDYLATLLPEYEFWGEFREGYAVGQPHDYVLAYEVGGPVGINKILYVSNEADLAEQFAPVLHRHPWELQEGLADFRDAVTDPGSTVRGFNALGQQFWEDTGITSLHKMYNDCGDADSYGAGTIPGVNWQFDPANYLLHTGAPTGERPLYYHVFPTDDGAVIVQYWMYFNGNDEREMAGPGSWHEGDWEWLSVRAVYSSPSGRWVPTHVNFYQHEGGITVPASECWWTNTRSTTYVGLVLGHEQDLDHPHAWVAANAHGTYNRYQRFYKITVPQNDYYDHVDYNITDNPYGDHQYFPYDNLVPMGELSHPPEAHGCDWLGQHWSQAYGGASGMDDLAFVGCFGQRHCPDNVPEFFCQGGFVLWDFWFGAKSPVQAQGSHEWRDFTINTTGFGNGNSVISWESFQSGGCYLGRFVLTPSGGPGRVRFAIPSVYLSATATARIASGSVTFVNENAQREISLILRADDTYVFDETAASGSGPVAIDIIEDDVGLMSVMGLLLDVAQPGSAGVDVPHASGGMAAEFAGVPKVGQIATLRLSGVARGAVSIRIVDVAGRMHENRTAQCSENCDVPVKMPELSGVYFIRVQASGGVSCTKRVVLVR